MKRIVATMAAAVIIGAQFAQAQSGGVSYSFYGRLHASAEYLEDGDDGNFYLSSNASRFGVRGFSRLQDGMKVIWQIETRVDIDESGGTFATRDSFVGMDGQYGKLIAGRHDSPLRTLGRKTDLFGDQIGDSRNIIGISESGGDLRLNNVLMYTSPTHKDFTLNAAYAFGDDDDQLDVISCSTILADKELGLTAGLALERRGEMRTPVDKDDDGIAESASDNAESLVRVAAAYDWREFTLTGLYEIILNVNGGDDDRLAWGAGLAYKYSDHTFKCQYYGTDGGGTDEAGARMFALGYDLHITAASRVYVAYAATANESAAAYMVSGGAHGEHVTPAAGDDAAGLSAGFSYDF